MSEADETRAQIQQFRELMLGAVSNGSGAQSENSEGLEAIKLAIRKFEGAHMYVSQQLDFLVALSDQLELILEGTMNADLVKLQGDIRRAIRDTEHYRERIQFQINNLGKIRAIIEMQISPLIDATGTLLKLTNDAVEQWALYL